MSMESLSWWRADHERWAALDYVETLGFRTDENRETRTAVLRMLAQDRTSADADFIRHLVRQETAMHAASWGYGDSLGLAALLLADCRAVDDVWVLWTAKNANFDTRIGLDQEVLFGAGVAETLAFVRASSHPDRDELLRYVADELPMDQEVSARLASLREYHGM